MVWRLIRSLFSALPYTVWRHHSKQYIRRVRKVLSEHEFALIHCDCLPFADIVRHVSAVPTVLTDHDVSYLKALRMAQTADRFSKKLFLFYEARKLQRFERSVLAAFDRVVTVSQYDQQRLKELSPAARLEVVENGVDIDHFLADHSRRKNNVLLWFGGFGHQPNLEAMEYFLRDVYGRIKAICGDVQLVVLGGSVPEGLRRYAADDDSVKFLGFVDDPIPYLASANVIICPILSGSGTRLKILEAMAMEKAIVSSSIGIEGIKGEHGKHFLIADGPRKFAESVVSILKDGLLEAELGRNARRLVAAEYDWRTVIWPKNTNLYMQLIDGGPEKMKAGREPRKTHS